MSSVKPVYSLGRIIVSSHPADDASVHATLPCHRVRRCQSDVGRLLQEGDLQMELLRNSLRRSVGVSRPNYVLDVQSLRNPRLPNSNLRQSKKYEVMNINIFQSEGQMPKYIDKISESISTLIIWYQLKTRLSKMYLYL